MPSAIITGGTRGIGACLVKDFAKEGFDIVTCARNQKDITLLEEFMNLHFPKIKFHVLQCDVSIKNEVQDFGKKALELIGTPDVLINNTGIFLPGKCQNEEDGVFEKQINTNLASSYHLTRMLLPSMISKKGGYIFNICSIASIAAYANGGSYTISKFGLLGFTKVLREELKEHHIRVSAILPGATKTSSWDGTDLPEERFIDPKDLSSLLLYLYKAPSTMMVEEILIRPFLGDIA